MALSRAKRVALYDSDDEDDYYERHYGANAATVNASGGRDSHGQRRPLLNRSDEVGRCRLTPGWKQLTRRLLSESFSS